MSEHYAISRIESYKYSDVGGVLKEALRILPNYDNPDCNPELSYLNVALVECDLKGLTPEKYILKYREDNNIKGRFNTVAKNKKSLTNCMCQCLFTASADWINQFSRDEQIDYFNHCLDFFKSEFPSVKIIAANIHFDETTPHLHITYLPIVERVNKKTEEIEHIFSTTKLMPGKDFFPQYQERFFNFISEKYDGFTRGKSDRKNMSVKEFKEYSELKNRCNELYQELEDCKRTIYNQRQKLSSLYDELKLLNKFRKVISLFEKIPLIGELFKILIELSDNLRYEVLERSIELAKEKLNKQIAEKNEISLDSQIMAADKRKILDRLFGSKDKNNQYRKNKDMEI